MSTLYFWQQFYKRAMKSMSINELWLNIKGTINNISRSVNPFHMFRDLYMGPIRGHAWQMISDSAEEHGYGAANPDDYGVPDTWEGDSTLLRKQQVASAEEVYWLRRCYESVRVMLSNGNSTASSSTMSKSASSSAELDDTIAMLKGTSPSSVNYTSHRSSHESASESEGMG
jgi:hypothetical protein